MASVCRGGESLSLRPKTYRVLLYLLEHPNRLVTKEELVASVWDGAAVTDDVLVRCIADLRKAFQDDPKSPRILKTFPKVGYGLMANVEVATAERPSAGASDPARAALDNRAPHPVAQWRRLLRLALLLLGTMGLLWWGWRREPAAPGSEDRAEAAWWKLDEGQGATVGDSSRNRLAGKAVGAVSWSRGAKGGLTFHGADGVVSGTSKGALPEGDRPRSINVWIKPAGPLVDTAGLFGYGSRMREPTPGRFELLLNLDGTLRFGSPLRGSHLRGRTAIAPDGWRMVTGIYEGPPSHRAFLMVDGVVDSEMTFNPPPATDAGSFWQIGHGVTVGAFRGEMRDLRVYGEPLTEAKVRALYRCSSGRRDIGDYYYAPVFGNAVGIGERAADASSVPIRNGGKDFAGVQFARSDGTCGLAALRAADAGQDLRIAMDILTPSDAEGRVTEGGPYLRSRRAMAGDGLIGGESAGYWVLLKSTGMVKIKRLNPQEVVAFSPPPADFDAARFHRLEVEARGDQLRVWLDGKAVTFEQADARTASVRILPAWEGPPRVGWNRGAAGVAFGAEENRGAIGGQEARNIQVTRLDAPEKSRR